MAEGKSAVRVQGGGESSHLVEAHKGVEHDGQSTHGGATGCTLHHSASDHTGAGLIGRFPRWAIAEGADVFQDIAPVSRRPFLADFGMGLLPVCIPVGLALECHVGEVGKIRQLAAGIGPIPFALVTVAIGAVGGIEFLALGDLCFFRVQAPGVGHRVPDVASSRRLDQGGIIFSRRPYLVVWKNSAGLSSQMAQGRQKQWVGRW